MSFIAFSSSFSFGMILLGFSVFCNIVWFFYALIGNYTTHEKPELVLWIQNIMCITSFYCLLLKFPEVNELLSCGMILLSFSVFCNIVLFFYTSICNYTTHEKPEFVV